MDRPPFRRLAVLGVACLAAGSVLAQDAEFRLALQGHRFDPAELTVPAGQKVKLVIDNRDATPEEFESKDLRREKLIPANGTGTVTVGPLKPGRYAFFGEFNPKTAQGVLIAK
jgi:hypothetical protein